MKYLGVLLAASLSLPAFAHDEGHGPKLTDGGKMGGIMTAVVLAKDAKLGAKAPLVYKAELTRADDGTVRVYFYDKDMKTLDIAGLPKTAKASIEAKKRKKWTSTPFILEKNADGYEGKAPKPASKPFNIDVTIIEGKRELLAAFDGLD
jgi:hypothetical protein